MRAVRMSSRHPNQESACRMSFPPGFLEELRERVSLAATVGRKVRLIRRGREHTGLCPFHNEKTPSRSEEHTSELQSLMRISYAVFSLKKKKHQIMSRQHNTSQ